MNNRKFWISLAISAIFIWLFVRTMNFKEVWLALEGADYWYLIPTLVIFMFSFYMRTWRWQILLWDVKKITVSRLMSPLMIGFMGNSVLPLRLGEFIRAYMLTKQEGIPFSLGLGTIVMERILDSISLLLILAVILLSFPINLNVAGVDFMNAAILQKIGLTFLVLLIFGIGFLALLRIKPEFIINMIERILGKRFNALAKKLEHLLMSFADGLKILHSWKLLVVAMLQSLGVWLSVAASVYFVMAAFHLQKLPYYASSFIVVITAFGVSVPSAPGYIGTYHKFCQYAVQALGGEVNLASGFTIILHLSQMLPTIVIGFYYLWKQNISLKDLQNLKK